MQRTLGKLAFLVLCLQVQACFPKDTAWRIAPWLRVTNHEPGTFVRMEVGTDRSRLLAYEVDQWREVLVEPCGFMNGVMVNENTAYIHARRECEKPRARRSEHYIVRRRAVTGTEAHYSAHVTTIPVDELISSTPWTPLAVLLGQERLVMNTCEGSPPKIHIVGFDLDGVAREDFKLTIPTKGKGCESLDTGHVIGVNGQIGFQTVTGPGPNTCDGVYVFQDGETRFISYPHGRCNTSFAGVQLSQALRPVALGFSPAPGVPPAPMECGE